MGEGLLQWGCFPFLFLTQQTVFQREHRTHSASCSTVCCSLKLPQSVTGSLKHPSVPVLWCAVHEPPTSRRRSRIWSGQPSSLEPKGGDPEPNICSKLGFSLKLPENCMILKKSWGQGGPGPQGPLDPLMTSLSDSQTRHLSHGALYPTHLSHGALHYPPVPWCTPSRRGSRHRSAAASCCPDRKPRNAASAPPRRSSPPRRREQTGGSGCS